MIPDKDIQEVFIRSSGPGGQNVNKVSTAVRLRHIPTGIQVKSQKFRTQAQNRVYARELLIKAVEQKGIDAANSARLTREYERRRKRGERARPKGLKEKILRLKKHRSDKKASRRPVFSG